jgi:hypothetical protein
MTRDLVLLRWIEGDYVRLFTEARDTIDLSPERSQAEPTKASLLKRAQRLLQQGRLSDAVKALSFRGFDMSSNVFDILQSKHPPRASDTDTTGPSIPFRSQHY